MYICINIYSIDLNAQKKKFNLYYLYMYITLFYDNCYFKEHSEEVIKGTILAVYLKSQLLVFDYCRFFFPCFVIYLGQADTIKAPFNRV